LIWSKEKYLELLSGMYFSSFFFQFYRVVETVRFEEILTSKSIWRPHRTHMEPSDVTPDSSGSFYHCIALIPCWSILISTVPPPYHCCKLVILQSLCFLYSEIRSHPTIQSYNYTLHKCLFLGMFLWKRI
jgi:hypothetical protein